MDCDKDPVAKIPLLPGNGHGVMKKGSSYKDFFDLEPCLRANLSILAFRALAVGALPGVRVAAPAGPLEAWKTAGDLGKILAGRCADVHRGLTIPGDRPRGATGLTRFGGVVATTPSNLERQLGGGQDSKPLALLKKGDLCRAAVHQISLPAAGAEPVPITSVSPRAARWLNNFETKMLHPMGSERVIASEITPYVDPGLRSKRARVAWTIRMFEAGLLTFVDRIRGQVAPFTVVKKFERQPPQGREDIVMRLVLDQRRANLAWRKPPWTAMASPACFPFVRIPVEPGVRTEVMVGDLPDMYWTLALPEDVAPFFTLDVDLKDVSAAMGRRKSENQKMKPFSPPPGTVALAMRVPVMGWSWAVFLAQTTLEDLLEKNIAEFTASNRLHYQVVLPQFQRSHDRKDQTIHWEYIDDVGAMIRTKNAKPDCDAALLLGAKTRKALADQGLGFHKDLYGTKAETLGHEIEPDGFGIRPSAAKFWQAAGAIEHLLKVRRASPAQLAGLLGLLTWMQLVQRSLLSIWRTAYGFIRMEPEDEVTKVPEEVLEEFQCALFLLPFTSVKMTMGWHDRAYMTDSSVEGAGLISTKATIEELDFEAQFAETRGWMVDLAEVEEDTDTIRAEMKPAVDAEDPTAEMTENFPDHDSTWYVGLKPEAVPMKVKCRVITILHLFSGPCREEDLGWWLKVLCAASGCTARVENIDTLINPKFNLYFDEFYESIFKAVSAGIFDVLISGLPCSTWSKSRWLRPGPPVLRSRLHPMGGDPSLPPISRKEKEKLVIHNVLFQRSMALCRAGAESSKKTGHATENPKDPGRPPFASIFATKEAEDLRTLGAFDIVLDQCAYEAPTKKPTQILTNIEELKPLQKLCSHGPGAHPILEGVDSEGRWRTAAASRYPSPLCRSLAAAILKSRASQEAETEEEESRSEVATKSLKKVPPIAAGWSPIERWTEVFRCKWKQEDHNNLGELRGCILALRALARSQQGWGKRVLIATDSLVSLGALAKGRSRSWPILRLLRGAAAIQILCNIRPYWRYVESERNHADGPSRGHPIGQAPKWEKERDEHRARPAPLVCSAAHRKPKVAGFGDDDLKSAAIRIATAG